METITTPVWSNTTVPERPERSWGRVRGWEGDKNFPMNGSSIMVGAKHTAFRVWVTLVRQGLLLLTGWRIALPPLPPPVSLESFTSHRALPIGGHGTRMRRMRLCSIGSFACTPVPINSTALSCNGSRFCCLYHRGNGFARMWRPVIMWKALKLLVIVFEETFHLPANGLLSG